MGVPHTHLFLPFILTVIWQVVGVLREEAFTFGLEEDFWVYPGGDSQHWTG